MSSLSKAKHKVGSTTTVCTSCSNVVRIVRQLNGITIKEQNKSQVVAHAAALSEELIALVSAKLPPQPWPNGTHKLVARQLEIPHATVSRAIDQLIRRGVFKPQIDGVVFEPISPTAVETSSIAK